MLVKTTVASRSRAGALGGHMTRSESVAKPRLIPGLYDKITQGRKQYYLLIRRIHSSRIFYLLKRQSAPSLQDGKMPKKIRDEEVERGESYDQGRLSGERLLVDARP